MSGRNARRSMTDYSVASHALGPAAGDARMERYHEYVGRRRIERAVWPGAAFIVEALLLLVFLVGSLAVLMSLNADADRTGRESADLMDALVLASNAAEEFAADPEGTLLSAARDTVGDANVIYGDDLLLVREVTAEAREQGVMYFGVLTVWNRCDVSDVAPADEPGSYKVTLVDRTVEPVYTLETARYVPADGARTARSAAGAPDDAAWSVVLDDSAAPPVVGATGGPAADGADAAPTEGEVSRG